MKNYKFKEIKAYGSNDWLNDAQKKYRRVFENAETKFIYSELSFFNKLFDEEDWDANIRLKAYHIKTTGDELLCDLDKSCKVSMYDNVVYIRDGWGIDNFGEFWKRGDYRWEAWIDGELVGKVLFYVENGGLVSEDNNPYFNISQIKLYEGPGANVNISDRVYYKKTSAADTRFLWVEFEIENKQPESWYCELIFNYYNDSNQLFGTNRELKYIDPKIGDKFIIESGWGSETGGSWTKDKYTAEVIFMDQLIATLPFEVTDSFEEGQENFYTTPNIITSNVIGNNASKVTVTAPATVEELLAELDELIGLESIKDKLREFSQFLQFMKIRQEKGLETNEKIGLSAIFTGNPGTGKTTIANKLGKIYKHLGLISREEVIEVDRSDLVGPFIGQTAPKTKEILKKAKGAILFIDEAYALARGEEDSNDFGQEVIEVLLKEMSNPKAELTVIVAGYPNKMATFLESNPGLKSRFNHHFEFPDYAPQDLILIADHAARRRAVSFTDDARHALYGHLQEAYRNRDESFGNARLVNSIVNEAKMNMGLRLVKTGQFKDADNDTLSQVIVEDINQIIKVKSGKIPDIKVDEALLKEGLEELRALKGLTAVKKEVSELVKLVKFYHESGKGVLNRFSLHTVFMGNPGTGKTTVARIIAKIYKGLGIIERGHLVECDRQSMVAGYIGQTAIKTNDLIDRAMGGVLFIDEAYALTSGGENDFGREAVETLLKRMEDDRGQFIVIVAGYTDKMNYFLEANPGLKSRFDNDLIFEDYLAPELYEIAKDILAKENLHPNKEASEYLIKYIEWMYDTKDKYFGNARTVRKLIEDAIKNQNLRMAELSKEDRTEDALKTLTFVDLEEFKIGDTKGKPVPIGFKIPSNGR